MNTNRTAPRAIAFFFAALVTLATLSGIDRLAGTESSGVAMALAQATQPKA